MESQRSADAHPQLLPPGVAGDEGTDGRLPNLVQAARAGDAEAFGAIFDELHLAVYRYIAARVISPADAEDLAAETFAAAFRSIGSFRWRGPPFEAWLFRVARSKVVDHQRLMRRRPTDQLSGTERDDRRAADPSAELVRGEERLQLLAAIGRLSRDQQDVVALRFFADLSVPEVATVMGRSLGAVRQLQLRALTTLRQRMEWLR